MQTETRPPEGDESKQQQWPEIRSSTEQPGAPGSDDKGRTVGYINQAVVLGHQTDNKHAAHIGQEEKRRTLKNGGHDHHSAIILGTREFIPSGARNQ